MIRQKSHSDQSVLEAALDRIRYIYSIFDNVVVSFSGGKDSTCALNLTIKVAEELGRLPVQVVFYDWEVIHPPTVEYVLRIKQNPKIKLDIYCLPIKHRNACSNEEPWWYSWNPNEKSLWVRDMPEGAITEHPSFKFGMSFQDFSDWTCGPSEGMVARITGVRTQESFTRLKAVSRKVNENYIAASVGHGNTKNCHPIYDWSSEDVWNLVRDWGLDYNRTYDIFNRTKFYNKLLSQRVSPPFGEEPMRSLWLYSECFPEMWHKMLKRVKGVSVAWRYSNTEIFGFGKIQKPDATSWQSYSAIVVEQYTGKDKEKVTDCIEMLIRRHKAKTDDEIPEESPHPLTGMSWRFLVKNILRGDFKKRAPAALESLAIAAQKKLGIKSYKEAKRIYGN